MLSRLILPIAALLLAGCVDTVGSTGSPPPTRAGQDADTIQGRIAADPYRWLEGTGDEINAWLVAQNQYAADILGASAERPAVLRRIVELLRVDVATQPMERAGRYFFMKRAADQERFAIFMREGPTGIDRKIIDPFEVGGAGPVSVSLASVSANGGFVAYTVGRAGQDESEIRIYEVDRGRDLAFRLPVGLYTSIQILSDGSGVFYVRLETEGPRLYFHPLDRPALGDAVVFGDTYGPDAAIAAAITTDEKGLGIVVFHGQTRAVTEVWYRNIEEGASVRPIATGLEASFLPTFAGDRILLHTDWLAPNGRVLSVPLNAPERSNWVEAVAEGDDRIESVSVAGRRILVNTMHDAQSRLVVYEFDGGQVATVALPAPGTIESVVSQWSSPEAFFTFTSFVTPPTVLRYDVESGEVSTWHSPPVQVPAGIIVHQVRVRSADGTAIPMFIVHREGLPMDGGNPAMLTGFGALGVSLTPVFSAEAVIVAERGGVFAVANVRGGGEFGEGWHENGRGVAKSNAIDDFVAAAEWLVSEGFTTTDGLVATGSTHGGFLVSAAMARRPDLFEAVIADHPVADLIRLRERPTTAGWTAEYGSPDDGAQLDALLRISPYHNIRSESEYPAVLVISGGDSPVPSFHARKLVASIQASIGTKPALLRDITATGAVDPAVSLPIEYLADALTFYLSRTAGSNGSR